LPTSGGTISSQLLSPAFNLANTVLDRWQEILPKSRDLLQLLDRQLLGKIAQIIGRILAHLSSNGVGQLKPVTKVGRKWCRGSGGRSLRSREIFRLSGGSRGDLELATWRLCIRVPKKRHRKHVSRSGGSSIMAKRADSVVGIDLATHAQRCRTSTKERFTIRSDQS